MRVGDTGWCGKERRDSLSFEPLFWGQVNLELSDPVALDRLLIVEPPVQFERTGRYAPQRMGVRFPAVRPSNVPERIPIAHDDYHASRIGRLKDGRQLFVTTPFIPALGSNPGREFVAVYLFDSSGALLEARIDDLEQRPV